MAEATTGGSNNVLYFLVGGLVVVAGIFGYMYFSGGLDGMMGNKTEITIEVPGQPSDTDTTE
jgi:hypothetical protein